MDQPSPTSESPPRSAKPARSELLAVWGNTRMVVLTAMSASLYAAILIPFKVLPIIPGVTELRPANAVPVVCSFLFGPAGAWGAAIGNVIGDFFGGLGPGDFFGFVGNLLYGLIPYRVWRVVGRGDPLPTSMGQWLCLMLAIALAAGACALVIGWGLNALGFVPFALLANVVFLNNFLVASVIGPLLLWALYPRVRQARLRHVDILPVTSTHSRLRGLSGLCLVAAAVGGGLIVGNLISTGVITVPGLGPVEGTGALQIAVGLVPFLILLVLGLALL